MEGGRRRQVGATVGSWLWIAAAVVAQSSGEVVPSGALSLLMVPFAVLAVWRGELLVRRGLCFVVREFICFNALTRNVSHYFSCPLYPPR